MSKDREQNQICVWLNQKSQYIFSISFVGTETVVIL